MNKAPLCPVLEADYLGHDMDALHDEAIAMYNNLCADEAYWRGVPWDWAPLYPPLRS